MEIKRIRIICAVTITVLLASCLGTADIQPTPAPPTVEPSLPADLLTDEALVIEPDPNALPENEVWAAWIQANHHPIRSLTSEHYDDLQFLKPLLAGRYLVQMGEPAHGVAEINMLRVRLVKFLHEELGYDVIAFESGLFECYTINERTRELTPTQMLAGSIFGIWHTKDMLPLFEYIRATQGTAHPLTLAGFDIQNSSFQTASILRPQFLHDVVAKVDPTYAVHVLELDTAFFGALTDSRGDPAYWKNNNAELRAEYQTLMAFFDTHAETLRQAFSQTPQTPVVARQVAWGMIQYVDFLQQNDSAAMLDIRDAAMAENVDFLLNTLYPGKKIIVWAHNAHIRYNNQATQGNAFWLGRKTMGGWINERYYDAVYTIGFYFYRGQVASNNRQTVDVPWVNQGSLESILYRTGRKFIFVDLLHQTQQDGNTWMFMPIQAGELTGGYEPVILTLRDQYDGIIFIDTVNPPEYLY
jgi:erythromycin esterase